MANKSRLADFQFQIESDSNYPDNNNLTFIKPNNEAWTKEEKREVNKLVKKLMLDPEPIMDGMYSFDALTVEMIRRELGLLGMTEFVEANTYVPDFSEPKEEPDPNTCGGGCGSGCGGSCSAAVTFTSNPSDYYFKQDNDLNMVPPDFFIICPKSYWDSNQTICVDGGLPINTLLDANGFVESMEGIYEYHGNISTGKAWLLSQGFVEEPKMNADFC